MKARNLAFVQNASGMTLALLLNRVLAFAQTVALARILGQAEYGMFGFVSSSIGMASGIAGLQLGQSATVLVARAKTRSTIELAYVIKRITKMSLWSAAAATVSIVVLSPWLASGVFLGKLSAEGVILAGLIVPASIWSGVERGILEGFERFRSVIVGEVVGTVLSIVAAIGLAQAFGVVGALIGVLLGTLFAGVAYALENRRQSRTLEVSAHPKPEAAAREPAILSGFALPSMLTTLGASASTWFGSFLLTRSAQGLAAVAAVNVGLQWKMLIVLVASRVGMVAIPRMSALSASGSKDALLEFRSKLVTYLGAGCAVIALGVTLVSPWILDLYGPGFRSYWLPVSLIVCSGAIQTSVHPFLQHLVATGQVWHQAKLHLGLFVPMLATAWVFIPRFGAVGYAWSMLASWVAFAALVLLVKEPNG